MFGWVRGWVDDATLLLSCMQCSIPNVAKSKDIACGEKKKQGNLLEPAKLGGRLVNSSLNVVSKNGNWDSRVIPCPGATLLTSIFPSSIVGRLKLDQ